MRDMLFDNKSEEFQTDKEESEQQQQPPKLEVTALNEPPVKRQCLSNIGLNFSESKFTPISPNKLPCPPELAPNPSKLLNSMGPGTLPAPPPGLSHLPGPWFPQIPLLPPVGGPQATLLPPMGPNSNPLPALLPSIVGSTNPLLGPPPAPLPTGPPTTQPANPPSNNSEGSNNPPTAPALPTPLPALPAGSKNLPPFPLLPPGPLPPGALLPPTFPLLNPNFPLPPFLNNPFFPFPFRNDLKKFAGKRWGRAKRAKGKVDIDKNTGRKLITAITCVACFKAKKKCLYADQNAQSCNYCLNRGIKCVKRIDRRCQKVWHESGRRARLFVRQPRKSTSKRSSKGKAMKDKSRPTEDYTLSSESSDQADRETITKSEERKENDLLINIPQSNPLRRKPPSFQKPSFQSRLKGLHSLKTEQNPFFKNLLR